MRTENSKCGQSGLAKAEDCLLLIVDIQTRLAPLISGIEMVTENIVKLARFAEILRIPVVLAEQINLGETVPEIRAALGDCEALKKNQFDCFGSDALNARLSDSGRRVLLTVGIETHICVAQTAISGLCRYNVHVVADATSSRNLIDRDMAFQRMQRAGVTLNTTEMLMYELLEQAGTEEFRETLKLVKSKKMSS